jgi:ribosomal protein S27AE
MLEMNPFFQVIVSTVAALTRTCPNCGHRQIVAKRYQRDSVRCARCGKPIPPTVRAR